MNDRTNPSRPQDDTTQVNHSATQNQAPATSSTTTPATKEPKKVQGSIAGGTWVSLIIGALLLIVLLIFIMQNQEQVVLEFFTWSFSVPVGIGFLLAAIVGALIMAMVGVVRIIQLRRQIKKG